jgi:hypothetical protein
MSQLEEITFAQTFPHFKTDFMLLDNEEIYTTQVLFLSQESERKLKDSVCK